MHNGDWVLQPFRHNNLTYLLDKATGYVYADASEDTWPELVGRLERDGRVTFRQHADIMKFVFNLDLKLRNERMCFSQLFRRFDTDGNGHLDIHELSQLVTVRAALMRSCALC